MISLPSIHNSLHVHASPVSLCVCNFRDSVSEADDGTVAGRSPTTRVILAVSTSPLHYSRAHPWVGAAPI